MRYVRETIEPIPFSSLSVALRADLEEESNNLAHLPPIAPTTLAAAPDPCFLPLRHELSAHFVALNRAKPDRHRSPAEAAALANWARDSDGLGLASPSAFRARLAELNLCVTDGVGGWRSCPIHLDGDKAGHEVFFPPLSAIPAQLEKLRRFLAMGDAPPAIFSAAVAKALLLNCHPFTDGNGRVSRILLNHILRQSGMPAEVYLPFYEIARRSLGGYEIALRQAEIRGEWEPFLRFMLAAIQCHRCIASAHDPST